MSQKSLLLKIIHGYFKDSDKIPQIPKLIYNYIHRQNMVPFLYFLPNDNILEQQWTEINTKPVKLYENSGSTIIIDNKEQVWVWGNNLYRQLIIKKPKIIYNITKINLKKIKWVTNGIGNEIFYMGNKYLYYKQKRITLPLIPQHIITEIKSSKYNILFLTNQDELYQTTHADVTKPNKIYDNIMAIDTGIDTNLILTNKGILIQKNVKKNKIYESFGWPLFIKCFAGGHHFFGLSKEKILYGWGNNKYKQLGINFPENLKEKYHKILQLNEKENISITAGFKHSIFELSNFKKSLWLSCGLNNSNELLIFDKYWEFQSNKKLYYINLKEIQKQLYLLCKNIDIINIIACATTSCILVENFN